ncbi:fasciclin domain-containing protein [Bacteroides mediterraneensis]|uniref:fasciclin domain-containing protein n=1 Tax=Bacteroides mediterraneensis TaxID=1841856 RepID=UPI0009FB8648|nr:fasciclin domain-containing protein [Bacteroides mediterraneensis]
MKTFTYYLASIFALCILHACSDEESPSPQPPPSKGQEEVQTIVKVLKESEPQVSQFVEILEKTNVADLQESQLTVFAVKNANAASRTEKLDTASIKNHIIKGQYTKNELTEGSTLTSISNETLYVTREEDNIQINGIQIEGEAIPAGNSYVYVVPEVFPMLDGPIVSLHETTILVLLPTGEPLEGVTIEAQEGNGTVLGPFTTDENGAAIISHQNDTLTYVISKEGYSNLSDGFLIEGADANGNLIFTDLNGDGVINVNDKVNSEPYRYYLNYRNLTENSVTKICYMTKIEEVSVADIQNKWNEELGIYLTQVKNLEYSLLYDTYFDYNMVEYTSSPFWELAYQTLENGKKYLDQVTSLNTSEGWAASWDMTVDYTMIQNQLLGYYGKIMPNDNEASQDWLLYYLTDLISSSTEKRQLATRALLGKTYLISGYYQEALQQCQYILDSNAFSLDPEATNLSDSQEVLWGGYKDNFGNPGGSYIHPVLLREVYLMAAIAYSLIGNEMQATEIKNQLKEAFSLNGTDWAEYIQLLQGTGGAYPYYRLLNIPIEQTGFSSPTNYYLPIPAEVLNNNPDMTQNPGY